MKTTQNPLKIAVGMSGGVDSSISAYLLKQQGHHVIGLTMQIWDGSIPIKDEGRPGCYGPGEAQDIEAARSVCARLDIPYHVINLAQEYKSEVLSYFRNEYIAGRTPNPCVRCNHSMKFGFLLEKARAAGLEFDFFATGHYARASFDNSRNKYILQKALDPSKDQTYFLSFLTQKQLAQLMFPLGNLKKSEVKELAREVGWLDIAEKPESQDFIETSNYNVLVKPEDAKPGSIVNEEGRCVGTHNGIIHYTVGQRKGLGGGSAEPVYVTEIDGTNNVVRIGKRNNLYSSSAKASNLNWIALDGMPQDSLNVKAKIRQQHKEALASIKRCEEDKDTVLITFNEPQMAVTPGQTVAFYEGDTLLGAGLLARP